MSVDLSRIPEMDLKLLRQWDSGHARTIDELSHRISRLSRDLYDAQVIERNEVIPTVKKLRLAIVELQTAIEDIDVSGGTPGAHAATHQNGGADEISVAGLSGLLADAQTALAHAASHLPGGSDALTTAAAGTIQPDDTAATGSAASFARSDHRHAIAAAVAGAIEPDDAAAEGASTSFARADHKHSIVAAAPGAIQPDDSAAEGSATSFARSDHRHSIVAAIAGSATPGDTAAEGSATSFARSDHRHALPAFGTTAGTFAEGDDLASLDTRVVALESVSPIITQWTPDAPPTGSAHAKTDEFTDADGSAWDARWTEFDQSAELTTEVRGGFGKMTIVSPGASLRNVGMYQTIPSANDWVFAAKMHMAQIGAITGVLTIGVFLSESLSGAPTTADWAVSRLIQGSSTVYDTATYTAYNSTATVGAQVSRVDRGCYFRVRVKNTAGTYSAKWDWSDDGIGWHEMKTGNLTFTPVHFGVFARSTSTGGDAFVYVQWFRVAEVAVTFGELVPGGRVLNVFA